MNEMSEAMQFSRRWTSRARSHADRIKLLSPRYFHHPVVTHTFTMRSLHFSLGMQILSAVSLIMVHSSAQPTMLRLSSPTGSGPPLHHSAVHEVIHRFFIYDDDAITMRRWNEACVARFLNRSAAKLVKGVEDDGVGGLCVCDDDWVADALLLAQLKAHPARTASPSEAQLFVIPTPFYQSFACDATSTRKRSDVHTRLSRERCVHWRAASGSGGTVDMTTSSPPTGGSLQGGRKTGFRRAG